MEKAKSGGKTVRIPKILNILIIVVIVVCILMFGKVTNFIGKYTGETADDGSTIFKSAAEWTGAATTAALTETGANVWIPDLTEMVFNSEETEQTLNVGNSAKNSMYMKARMTISDQQVFETGILEPGKGIGQAELGAVFEPGSYTALMNYTFYAIKDGTVKKLQTVGTVSKELTVTVQGSGEKYKTGSEKFKSK